MIYYCYYQSPIGKLTIGCNETAIIGLWIENERYYPCLDTAIEAPEHPLMQLTKRWLDDYFTGKIPDDSSLPLEPKGTAFQKKVWSALRSIPYGKTVSYKELSVSIGYIKGFQAVGGAVGRNPISIIVPCHRVIGANGSLTGFAGGLDIKRKLLQHEKCFLEQQNSPE